MKLYNDCDYSDVISDIDHGVSASGGDSGRSTSALMQKI